jgi:hypothetical protein
MFIRAQGENRKLTLNSRSQCPLVVLSKVCWRQCGALGSEEVRMMGVSSRGGKLRLWAEFYVGRAALWRNVDNLRRAAKILKLIWWGVYENHALKAKGTDIIHKYSIRTSESTRCASVRKPNVWKIMSHESWMFIIRFIWSTLIRDMCEMERF